MAVKYNREGMEDGPQTGPEAIEYALKQLDLDQIEKEAYDTIKEGKKTKRPKAVALLKIVQGMRRNDQVPADYMIHNVPVIPPQFRPFAAQGGTFIPGDANVLYKDLWDIKEAHEEEKKVLGEKHSGQSRLDLYDAIRSVYGFGDAVKPKTKAKDIQGFLHTITGSTSKFGFVNRKLLSKTQDNTGRSTIIVEPDYGIDEIGIPEKMAFRMFSPYIQRRLKMSGMSDAEALKHTKDQDDSARRALEKEMEVRPVVYSRAPAWHKFSVLAGHAKLVEGNAIKTNPYVAKGLGADYDGDNQIGSVFCRLSNKALEDLDEKKFKKIQKNFLQNFNPVLNYLRAGDKASKPAEDTMYKTTKINTATDGVWMNVDLENFPHTDLNNVNKKNGYDIEFYNVPEGVTVLAYDEHSRSVVEAPVKYWSIHRGKEVEIVTLVDGSQIYTDNDPRAIYGVEAAATSLAPARFTPTDAINKKVMIPKAPDMISGFNSASPQYYDMLANEICSEKRNDFTVLMDYDFGQVIGCLCGDGWTDNYNTPRTCISDKEYDNANFIKDYLDRTVLPGVTMSSVAQANTKGKFGTSVTHTYYHKDKGIVSKAFKALIGGEGDELTSGAGNKHLPEWYTVANTDFLKGLINGLVATDGTICTSFAEGKDHEQLMISVTSISLRMLREAKILLNLIGAKGSISFSKGTVAGNDAWSLTIYTTYAKMLNLFSNCCMKRKAKTFIETPVSLEDTSIKFDYLPFPVCVSSLITPYFPSYKVTDEFRAAHPEISDEDWEIRVAASSFANGLYEDVDAGRITRAKARRIRDKFDEINSKRKSDYEKGLALITTLKPGDRANKVALSAEDASTIQAALGVLYTSAEVNDPIRRKLMNSITRVVRAGNLTKVVLESIKAVFAERTPFYVGSEDIVKEWISLIDIPIQWMYIETVEKTGKVETGYDLTVPGYETFMSSEGVILSNTINVHVPASDAAVKEAKEILMPSTFPFSNRDQDKLVPLPKQEQVLGLYTAATSPKTTPINFPSEQAAMMAIKTGQIPLSADIIINGKM